MGFRLELFRVWGLTDVACTAGLGLYKVLAPSMIEVLHKTQTSTRLL